MFGKKSAGPSAFGSKPMAGPSANAAPAQKKSGYGARGASSPMGGGRENWNHKKDPHKV